jgi:hydroxymethylbilane synthase
VPLRLGTRGSVLAVTQSRWVAARIEALTRAPVTLVEIKTAGDVAKDRPLYEIGGKGLFTGELDRALLGGEIDLAVHSLKDVPTELPEGISVGAVPEREDPRDVLIGPAGAGVTLGTLPRGGRVGTGSLRRMALLRALRPDVSPEEIRGNLDTRIRKVDQGEVDGIVVAAAGVHRLGARDRISEYFDLGSWLPAPGQGALAVAVRTDDMSRFSWLRALDHPPSRAATSAERALLAVLGAGCRLPVGALGLPFGGGLRLKGLVAHPDGTRAVRAEATGAQDDPDALGRSVAEALLTRGADHLLEGLPAMGPAPEV